MTTQIKNWLLNEYASVGKNLQIDSVMGAISDTIKEIKEKQLFDKRINVSKNISVLVYESGTVEVHISIDGVLSTYSSFKQPKEKKQFLVPFVAEETVWNNCVAKVEATSKEEAFAMVEQSIEDSNPFRDFNAEWDGINTVTMEVVETSSYGIGDEHNIDANDVEECKDDVLGVKLTFSAFDLLRLEKDAIYHAVEQELDGIDVLEMEMIPVGVSGNDVVYNCIPTEYKKEFIVRAYFMDMDEDPTTPYGEETYTIHAQTEAEALIAAKDLAHGSEIASGVNASIEVEIE